MTRQPIGWGFRKMKWHEQRLFVDAVGDQGRGNNASPGRGDPNALMVFDTEFFGVFGVDLDKSMGLF